MRYAVAALYHKKECGPYSRTLSEEMAIRIVTAPNEAAALIEAQEIRPGYVLYDFAVTEVGPLLPAEEVWG